MLYTESGASWNGNAPVIRDVLGTAEKSRINGLGIIVESEGDDLEEEKDMEREGRIKKLAKEDLSLQNKILDTA